MRKTKTRGFTIETVTEKDRVVTTVRPGLHGNAESKFIDAAHMDAAANHNAAVKACRKVKPFKLF